MLLCIEMVERTPNSVGIRQLSKRLIDTLLDGLTAVSYTHLDVYKRQAFFRF